MNIILSNWAFWLFHNLLCYLLCTVTTLLFRFFFSFLHIFSKNINQNIVTSTNQDTYIKGLSQFSRWSKQRFKWLSGNKNWSLVVSVLIDAFRSRVGWLFGGFSAHLIVLFLKQHLRVQGQDLCLLPFGLLAPSLSPGQIPPSRNTTTIAASAPIFLILLLQTEPNVLKQALKHSRWLTGNLSKAKSHIIYPIYTLFNSIFGGFFLKHSEPVHTFPLLINSNDFFFFSLKTFPVMASRLWKHVEELKSVRNAD